MNATVSLINSLYSNGTLSVELSCLYFKWLLVKVSIKYVFLSLKIVFIIPNSADLVKYRIMCHFIKALTVC